MQIAPLIAYTALVCLIITAMLLLSWILGERHKARATRDPYESGIRVTESARLRFPVKFYLVAMFFVIFDLEVVFIVAWAIAFREAGWAGYFAVLVFIAVLAVVLIYEWRTGALDFGPSGRKILKAFHKKYRT